MNFDTASLSGGVRVDLQVEGDTFWAGQSQMADAFGVTPQNITMHLRNIFKEGELVESAVCKQSLQAGRDGLISVKVLGADPVVDAIDLPLTEVPSAL